MFTRRNFSLVAFDTDGTNANANAGGGTGVIEPKTFSQDEVNKFVADEKRKYTKELETLQKNFKGTDEQRQKLEQQIATLKSEFQTKEERAADEWSRKFGEVNTQLEEANKSSTKWRSSYSNLLMERDLIAAAARHEAFNPDLIVRLMSPNGELVETVGDDGTPTGNYEARFTVSKKGKDGKPVQLKVNAEEAVKFMTEQPDLYGSLFKSTKAGGVGGNNQGQGKSAGGTSYADLVKAGAPVEEVQKAYREQYIKKG